MSYSILAKLPKHLAIIKKIKESPSKIIITALLNTETELIWNRFPDNKARVASWLRQLEASVDHDGDCVNQSAPCVLCHTLGDIRIAEEDIMDASSLLPDLNPNDLFPTIIEIILLTQPAAKYKSKEEMYQQVKGFMETQRALGYEDDIALRVEQWQKMDDVTKSSINEEIQSLLSYVTNYLVANKNI